MENSSQAPSQPQPASLVYAWYVVAILTLAYVFSFIDRQIIGLLVGPIKKDLSISDVQISYLMGVSFALFYTFFGIPLGWLADRFSRRLLIAIGVTIWSLMTAGCGLCNQFWQLALMRMGVGVGEAALSPAAYSLIADYFPPHRRATAMSVYTMGIYVGSGLALVLGGQIIRLASGQDQYQLAVLGSVTPWQLVFICVGLPGILVALLFLTIREPERSKSRLGASASSTWKETLGYLWSNRATLIFLNVGVALVAMSSYANMSWIPEMFSRRYGWATAYTGLIFGAIMSICGVIGVVGGGWLSDRWLQQGYQDAPLRVAFWSSVLALPGAMIYPLAASGGLSAWLLIPVVLFGSAPFGIAPAAIQRIMPGPMRAQATAVYLFVINLLGMGLGPTLPAWLTEKLFKQPTSLHLSLMIVGVTSFGLSAICLWLSRKSYQGSLDRVQLWNHGR